MTRTWIISSSLTSNTQQWHFLTAPLVQRPASSPVSFYWANPCNVQPGNESVGWRWRRLPSLAAPGPGRNRYAWHKEKVFTLRGWTPATQSSLSYLWRLCLNGKLFPPSLSALRSPTLSHLVQLQHHRCVDSSWQWRRLGGDGEYGWGGDPALLASPSVFSPYFSECFRKLSSEIS